MYKHQKIIFGAAITFVIVLLVSFFIFNSGTTELKHPAFGVSLEYPDNWLPNPDGAAFENVPLYYSGSDGFFGIDAVAAPPEASFGDVINSLILGKQRTTYGSEPSISSTTIAGMDARLVLPSDDQPEEAKNEAALVVKYPKPLKIRDNLYTFFMIYGDAKHIEKIGRTLEFIGFAE